jgi:Tubulin/FtsZ family, GTPase domain
MTRSSGRTSVAASCHEPCFSTWSPRWSRPVCSTADVAAGRTMRATQSFSSLDQVRACTSDGSPSATTAALSMFTFQDMQCDVCCSVQKSPLPVAGNNWALGYMRHGAACAGAALEALRREAEQADHLAGVVLLQSLAGGTGAGFGSRVAEEIATDMPSTLRLSCAVWPYSSGEVVVQAYNSLLSVHALMDACDGIVLMQNDELHGTCVVRT